jgi:pimeloyl-ACP methyl ester carboxylesterase
VSRPATPRLERLQASLDAGDLDGVRRILLDLDGEEAELLEQELGRDAFERSRLAAARGRRGGKLGKVLVLPGIMGSELDAVDRTGAAHRVWIDFLKLIGGHVADLELTPEGEPARPGLQIRTAGVHRKTYVPLLMELDTRWHVRPFPFDWREDIERSAARLDGEIKAFGAGEPVHLVAHSMGGLVSRRFAQSFPDTWRAMDDPDGSGRGGRLIMLGTPNRGSFAIPLTMSGVEKVVRMLAAGDLHHSLDELLAIIGTFPGMYQMLPSPLVDLGDEHTKLFDARSWGTLPVRAPLLARGEKLMRDLEDVIDPQRLLYVAGVNRETPAKIRIEAAGRFSYRQTLDGDGRVPHELGLLDGVATYWVDEEHGDLAKNGQVLDAITELLQSGRTSVLPTTKPAPPPTRAVPRGWLAGDSLAPLSPEVDLILAKANTVRRADGQPELTPEEAVRLENLALDDYLGSGEDAALRTSAPEAVAKAPTAAEAAVARLPKIAFEVVWGDVTKIDADVYTVGHYEGVLPQRAELALDEVVSGVSPKADYDRRRLVITQHTRRGTVRGELGDVAFFPWGDPAKASRVVAIVGMGRPGTFDVPALRRLVSGLVIAVSALPNARTIGTVLIGSGEGSLTIPEALRGFLAGLSDATDEIAAATERVFEAPIERIVIVERDRGRAEEILEVLRAELMGEPAPARSVELTLSARLRRGAGGAVSVEEGLALVADALLKAASASGGSPEGKALAALLARTDANQTVRKLAFERLRAEGRAAGDSRRPRFRVERRGVDLRRVDIPTRISFWDDGQVIRTAAIHEAATVPERLVGVARDVVDDLTERMTDPALEDVGELSDLIYRLLLPPDFRDVLSSGSLVFEVDRSMARLHWEMLASAASENGDAEPLSVRARFARQLRTTYSPSPSRPSGAGTEFRALVIGDPGDPERGEDLPGARSEALKVKEILEARDGIVVDARIGAPSVPREGRLQGVKPADRLEVLSLLLRGGYDLVHYAGHGDFDPEQPNRVGWVFARGLLTPGEIGRLERVPALIVSNACLSARTSQMLEGTRRTDEARSEAGLLPSLADEFFRLGVRNYVGAAWEVNDVGAELFAGTFYDALLGGESFGEAVRLSREALWRERDTYGPLWAAYQHYGDPASESGLVTSGRSGVMRPAR